MLGGQAPQTPCLSRKIFYYYFSLGGVEAEILKKKRVLKGAPEVVHRRGASQPSGTSQESRGRSKGQGVVSCKSPD